VVCLRKKTAEFILEAQKLKDEHRKGWRVKAGIRNPESVADHTYGLAVLAMLFSDNKGLDTEKCMRMAILHDLAEVTIGDLLPGESNNKRDEEDKVMKKLLTILPSSISKRYLQIWKEFRIGRSKEAKLVHQLDKIEMVAQALRYSKRGVKKETLQIFFESAKGKIKDNDLRNLFNDFNELFLAAEYS